MPRHFLSTLILAALALTAQVAGATFVIDRVTSQEEGDATDPHVASSPFGMTMVAYYLHNNVVLMEFVVVQPMDTDPSVDSWFPPVTLNSGSTPRIAWSREGFLCAFISGSVVLVYHTDLAGNWDQLDYELIVLGGAVRDLDLWANPWPGAGPYAYLVIEDTLEPPFGPSRLQFASLDASGWSDLETIVTEADGPLGPKVTWTTGPAGPWPTVFYHDLTNPESELVYTTKELVYGWTPPAPVPGPLAGPFDVVSYNAFDRSLLGMGPQPTCPCGTIHHVEYDAGVGWLPDENLTVHYMDMDWPMSPNIDIDSAGRLHVFWYQLGSGPNLDPRTKTLEYWVREDGIWTEHGQFMEGHENPPLRSRVTLDVAENDAVVMGWSRLDTIDGEPQPEHIWIARPSPLSAVPDDPSAELTVKAWPNPFNPFLQVEFTLTHRNPALATIFDLRGSRVATLHNGLVEAGTHRLIWNGRDDADRALPSGVYLLRLQAGDEVVDHKVVLEK